MELKVDSVFIGRVLGGVVIFLGIVSAIVSVAGARAGGFDLFLARLALPLGVGILIIAATVVLKAATDRKVAPRTNAPNRAMDAPRRVSVPRSGGATRADTASRTGEAARVAALQGFGVIQGKLRLNPGNITASAASIFVVISVFIPWGAFFATDGNRSQFSEGFTLWEIADEGDVGGAPLFAFILLALGIVGMASVVLPRWAGLVVGIVGIVMTLATFIYLFAVLDDQIGDIRVLGSYRVDVVTIPHVGFFLSGAAFLLITIVRLIPPLNRTRVRGGPPTEV